MKINTDKIKTLCKKKGVSVSFLCKKVGQGPYYLNDVKRRNGHIPAERLSVFADILNTTVEYLTDQTDDPSKKEKPAAISDELWDMIENDPKSIQLLEMLLKMTPEQRDKLEKMLEEI